jgi:hypothetical protein
MVTFLSKNLQAVTGKEALVMGRHGAADMRYLIKYGKAEQSCLIPTPSSINYYVSLYIEDLGVPGQLRYSYSVA